MNLDESGDWTNNPRNAFEVHPLLRKRVTISWRGPRVGLCIDAVLALLDDFRATFGAKRWSCLSNTFEIIEQLWWLSESSSPLVH